MSNKHGNAQESSRTNKAKLLLTLQQTLQTLKKGKPSGSPIDHVKTTLFKHWFDHAVTPTHEVDALHHPFSTFSFRVGGSPSDDAEVLKALYDPKSVYYQSHEHQIFDVIIDIYLLWDGCAQQYRTAWANPAHRDQVRKTFVPYILTDAMLSDKGPEGCKGGDHFSLRMLVDQSPRAMSQLQTQSLVHTYLSELPNEQILDLLSLTKTLHIGGVAMKSFLNGISFYWNNIRADDLRWQQSDGSSAPEARSAAFASSSQPSAASAAPTSATLAKPAVAPSLPKSRFPPLPAAPGGAGVKTEQVDLTKNDDLDVEMDIEQETESKQNELVSAASLQQKELETTKPPTAYPNFEALEPEPQRPRNFSEKVYNDGEDALHLDRSIALGKFINENAPHPTEYARLITDNMMEPACSIPKHKQCNQQCTAEEYEKARREGREFIKCKSDHWSRGAIPYPPNILTFLTELVTNIDRDTTDLVSYDTLGFDRYACPCCKLCLLSGQAMHIHLGFVHGFRIKKEQILPLLQMKYNKNDDKKEIIFPFAPNGITNTHVFIPLDQLPAYAWQKQSSKKRRRDGNEDNPSSSSGQQKPKRKQTGLKHHRSVLEDAEKKFLDHWDEHNELDPSDDRFKRSKTQLLKLEASFYTALKNFKTSLTRSLADNTKKEEAATRAAAAAQTLSTHVLNGAGGAGGPRGGDKAPATSTVKSGLHPPPTGEKVQPTTTPSPQQTPAASESTEAPAPLIHDQQPPAEQGEPEGNNNQQLQAALDNQGDHSSEQSYVPAEVTTELEQTPASDGVENLGFQNMNVDDDEQKLDENAIHGEEVDGVTAVSGAHNGEETDPGITMEEENEEEIDYGEDPLGGDEPPDQVN